MRILDLLSLDFGASWIPIADVVLKATLLLLGAALASFLLRRRSAAVRHMIWTLALASVLILPVLSVALPRWQVKLLTIENGSQSATSDQLPLSPYPLLPPSSIVTAPEIQRPTADRHAPVAGVTSHGLDSQSRGAIQIGRSARAPWSWSAILLSVWTAGALLILGRLAAGVIAVQWMSRRVERVSDAPWLEHAKSLAESLGISPRIVFLRSNGAAMPMAWGLVRPAVLMPADADHWPADRLRIVLLHELAHVKRHDCLTHMLAQVSCALHWFNPLAWVAARRVRTERERACDDLVLAAGTRGSDYADQLIEIARVMRAGRFPAILAGASLAMAHRSELEGRLLAILDPSVPRVGLSRLRTAAATAIFALGALPLAALQPWQIVAAEGQQPTPATAAQTQPVPAPQPVLQPSPQPRPQRQHEREVVRNAEHAGDMATSSVQAAVQTAVATVVPSAVQGSVIGSTIGASVAAATVTGVQTALAELHLDPTVDPHVNLNLNIQHDPRDNRRAGKDAQGKTDPRTVAALTAALKDSDKEVRETALHALAQMRDPSVFDPLLQALSDASPDVRQQAAFGLGQMRDRRAVDPLIAALTKDQNADVREQAAFALGQIRDRAAVPGLSAALKDSNDDVRQQAVFALGQIRDPSSVDAIVSAVRDAKADVRQQAVFALGQIRDRRAVEPLISALKDSDADVRQQAAFALGQIRDARAVEALVVALKDTVADVRQQSAFALGQLRDPRAIDGLTAALKDSNVDVRKQAAFALGQLAR